MVFDLPATPVHQFEVVFQAERDTVISLFSERYQINISWVLDTFLYRSVLSVGVSASLLGFFFRLLLSRQLHKDNYSGFLDGLPAEPMDGKEETGLGWETVRRLNIDE